MTIELALNFNLIYETGIIKYLALLVAVGQNLKTVRCDCQKLNVISLQQRDHLLQPTGKTNGHLRSLLVKQKVVKSCNGVKQYGFHWRAEN